MDIKLTVTVTGKPTFTLTEDNLYDQDLSVGYGASDFSFGLFNAGNFNFTVANENLQYSRDDFAGARIKLEYGTQTMGWYNVDRIKEQDDGYALEIQCYDDILKFDCPFTANENDFPLSFERALSHCMYLAGLATADYDSTSLAVITRSEVADISIQKSFIDVMDNYTCRDVVRAIAELSCCQATLDTDGRLLLNNPFRGSSFEQDLSDRVAMEYDRETKPISKVKITTVPSDGTSETFEYGTDTGHTVDFTLPTLSGCLLRDDILLIVQSAHNQLNGRAVSALSATHEIMGDEIKLYRVGDRYLADDTSGEPLRKRLDGMITSIRYSGNFEFSYSCPGFSQEGNGTSASGNPSGSIVAKILSPVSEEIRRSNVQLAGLISNAKAELSDAIEILDGDFGVVSQQVGEIQSDIYGLQVNYADIFAEMYDTEQGMRARLYKAETEIVAQAGLITSKVGQIDYDEFVSDIYGVTESIEQDLSVVEQTAQSISATVSSHTGQISGLESRLTSAQAQIDVQSDQISQTVTKTEFNNLEIGGRNLLLNSGVAISNADYTLAQYDFGNSKPLEGELVTITLKGQLGSDRTGFRIYNSGSARDIGILSDKGNGYYSWTGEWKTTHPTQSISNTFMRVFQFTNSGSSTSQIEWIKLEKGTKATDWSPAPEDIDNAIATVDGKFSNYSTTTQMNSAIDQKADSITSTVSATYTTKSDFNNLQIGGTNLLPHNPTFWEQGLLNGATGLPNSSPTRIRTKNYIPIASGDTIISKHCDCQPVLYFYDGADNLVGYDGWVTENQRVVVVPAGAVKFKCVIRKPDDSNITIDILSEVKIKFEKGTKATDWSPAPEDINSEIVRLDSAIVQTAESINLSVAKKVGKTEIISTINQSAETITIDASKMNLNGVVTANNNFKINLDGSMETVAGKIANFVIKNNVLYSDHDNYRTVLKSDGQVAFATGVPITNDYNVTTGANLQIYHDGTLLTTDSNGGILFRVAPSGSITANNITATNADITGKITSNNGAIADWEIASGILKSGSGNNAVVLKSTGTVRIAAGLARSMIDAGSTAIDNSTGGITTYLTSTGYFKCSNADITGSITATSGKIANFNIQGNVQHATSGGYRTVFKSDGSVAFATGVPTTNAYNSTTGANLQIYHNGTIIANDVRASGGNIGDWNISNGALVSSTGMIIAGTISNGIRIKDGELGFFANSSLVSAMSVFSSSGYNELRLGKTGGAAINLLTPRLRINNIDGLTTTRTIGGVTFTWTNGILTGIS